MSVEVPANATEFTRWRSTATDAVPVGSPTRYLDEDLSWLDVWSRLLWRAEAGSDPLLERVRLFAETGRVLDGFFELRGAGLRALSAGGHDRGGPIRTRAQDLAQRQDRLWSRLRAALAQAGIPIHTWADLDADGRRGMGKVFSQRLLPVLAALAIEPGHPLPAPSNRTICFAVQIGKGPTRRFGWIELPPVLPRYLPVPTGGFLAVEEVVAAHLPVLFPGQPVKAHAKFRITRQGGVPVSPESRDLLTAIERQLRHQRQGGPVRLEIEAGMRGEVRDRLIAALDLTEREVYTVRGLLGPRDLVQLTRTGDPDLRAPAWRPAVERRLQPPPNEELDLFSVLDDGDVLGHGPYDQLTRSTEALLAAAARDGRVLAIKHILYRPTTDSPVVRSLLRAAERGNHVVVLVELAARLSEKESVACARALEKAGAHVVYGLVGLRTHCPVTLVVRQSSTGVRRYGMVSTGPHHGAGSPDGLSLLSADPDLTADLADVFNYITGYSRPNQFRKIVLAPTSLRGRLAELIRKQTSAGAEGRIALKLGRLVDRELIDMLYGASAAGTPVEVVVSGACALRPGVAGLSDTIRVRAGEHIRPDTVRLFGFGSGPEAQWYLSSADFALRNLDRQVDVAVPVDDDGVRARVEEIFTVLADGASWELGPDGAWRADSGGADDELRRRATLRASPRSGGSLRA